jgi:sulfur-carrier protein adenylyltransferase/sulfurtransferase
MTRRLWAHKNSEIHLPPMKELIRRYARHLSLPDFTMASQQTLAQAKVLVIGCGGLGHPVLQYLTSSGVGHIGMVDNDTVHISNLHRQVLFTEENQGLSKVHAACAVLRAMNSSIQFSLYETLIDQENAEDMINGYDLIMDCSDNFATRYLLDAVCAQYNKPLIHGSVYRFEGRVSILNGNAGIRYKDIYPDQPEEEEIPDCEIGGVLGSLTGIIGSIMATEAIKWITGKGECLDGRMMIFDSLKMTFYTMRLKKNRKNDSPQKHTGDGTKMNTIQEITAKELQELMRSGAKFTLIDVRELHEYEAFNLGGTLIPLGEIPVRYAEIPRNQPVVIHCKAGIRSAHAINFLQEQYGYDNLLNLKRGILDFHK